MKTNLVAEIGINHNGSLKIAKQLIDLAILGGCKYVKFQKRTVEDVYTEEELDRYRESPWGTTNREQKLGLEFGKDEYDEIDRYCKEKGIEWFGSPWDIKSFDFLMQYNPKYIKIASAMITDVDLLEHINDIIQGTNTKVIISTGMSDITEINDCLDIFGDKVEYVLSCVSTYPTPIEETNMGRLLTLQINYGDSYDIGYSNHSSGILAILMAAILNAKMIEYHITLDRTMYGSDQPASIEKTGVMKLRKYIEGIEKSWGSSKIECTPSELKIKEKLRKK